MLGLWVVGAVRWWEATRWGGEAAGAPPRPWVAGGWQAGLVGVGFGGVVEAREVCRGAGGRVAHGGAGAEA
jgi:hypothetical protein